MTSSVESGIENLPTRLQYCDQCTRPTEYCEFNDCGVAVILLWCKKRILYPYLRLISILGWRPLFFSAVEPPFAIRCSNRLYLTFIITIMLTGHFLEYAACHSEILEGKESPKFLHMLPSLFHIGAYMTVLHYSRKPESERLETLMERVFLQSSQIAGWLICHKKLMKELRNFFVFCMTWVLVSLSMRLMHYIWYETVYRHAWMCNYDWPMTYDNRAFTIIRIACSSWNDLVCAAIVTTYSVHCQLNISYIRNLCTIVREKRIPLQVSSVYGCLLNVQTRRYANENLTQAFNSKLKEFFKRVEESRNFIDYLNSDQAVGISLLMMNLLCHTGISVIALLHPPAGVQFTWKASCVLALSIASCLSLILVNLNQSLKLTNACQELRNIGHEIKSTNPPAENERDDLDSLVLYTSSLDMEAKILQIPVRSSCLALVMILLTFTLLLLAQFGYINF